MKKKTNLYLKTLGLVLLCLLGISFVQIKAHAEDYDKIDYKTVGSFDEYWELMASDDKLFAMTADDLGNSEKIWYFDVEEPGWFVVSIYNLDVDEDYWSNTNSYMYSNKMFTETVSYNGNKDAINGDIYSYRCNYRYFLTKGRYYYKIKDSDDSYVAGDGIARFRFYFITNRLELKVDNIIYNDEYSVANVNFKPISKKIYRFDVYDKELTKDTEVFASSSHNIISKNIDWEKDTLNEYIENGFEINQNGTYTIALRFGDDEYHDYYAIATFTIDKIGAKANDIEAKSVKMSKTKATLKVGETVTLKATIKPKDVTDKTVTWKSSNKKVATVDKNGKVTAKKKGTCTITAVTSNSKKAKCKITVKK